jgi:hypothetical protein
MEIDILKEYAALEAMDAEGAAPGGVEQALLCATRPRAARSNRTYLLNQIIYRIQELTYGGLTKADD